MDSENPQLNLSDFPNIVPSSNEEVALETQRRSHGIATIRDIMENLINTMQSYLVDLQDMDSKVQILEQQRAELVEIEKQLRYEQHQLEVREKGLNEQLEYIKMGNKELDEREKKLNQLKDTESSQKQPN